MAKPTVSDDTDTPPSAKDWGDRFRRHGIAVIVSIVTLAVVLYQSYELRRSNQFSVESMQLQNRAWVAIRAVQMIEPVAAGERLVLGFEATNTGAMPALEVKLTERATRLAEPCAEDHVHETLGKTSENVIAPNSIFVYPAVTVELSENLAEAVKVGRPLYSYGRVQYEDIFGAAHTTLSMTLTL